MHREWGVRLKLVLIGSTKRLQDSSRDSITHSGVSSIDPNVNAPIPSFESQSHDWHFQCLFLEAFGVASDDFGSDGLDSGDLASEAIGSEGFAADGFSSTGFGVEASGSGVCGLGVWDRDAL